MNSMRCRSYMIGLTFKTLNKIAADNILKLIFLFYRKKSSSHEMPRLIFSKKNK